MPKFCSKCGNPLKDNDKFCRKCGSPVAAGAPEVPAERPAEAEVVEMPVKPQQTEPALRKGNLTLNLEEMLRGCKKVVDFGSGIRYEIIIPAGLSPGDTVKVSNTGIIDPDSGDECEIELTLLIE